MRDLSGGQQRPGAAGWRDARGLCAVAFLVLCAPIPAPDNPPVSAVRRIDPGPGGVYNPGTACVRRLRHCAGRTDSETRDATGPDEPSTCADARPYRPGGVPGFVVLASRSRSRTRHADTTQRSPE